MSRPTGRTSFSVISAKARAALRCKSTLSEKDSVVKAANGGPSKKLVEFRSKANGVEWWRRSSQRKYALSKNCSRSATASRSFSSNSGSYDCDLREETARWSRVNDRKRWNREKKTYSRTRSS